MESEPLEVDVDEERSESGSLDGDSNRKLQRKLMAQAIRYQVTMRGRLRGRSDKGVESFYSSLTASEPEESFSRLIENGSSIHAYSQLVIFECDLTRDCQSLTFVVLNYCQITLTLTFSTFPQQ